MTGLNSHGVAPITGLTWFPAADEALLTTRHSQGVLVVFANPPSEWNTLHAATLFEVLVIRILEALAAQASLVADSRSHVAYWILQLW